MIQKRGLSDVVSTVLIILIAVVAVSVIGVIALNLVNRSGSELQSSVDCQEIILNPLKCSYSGSSSFSITSLYERKDGTALNITKLEAIIELANGATVKQSISNADIPGILETKSSSFTMSGSAPQRISFAATITDSNGEPGLCSPTRKVECISGRTNGVCGSAARNYNATEVFPAGAFCISGTAPPSSPILPPAAEPANSVRWTCQEEGGGSSQDCFAYHFSENYANYGGSGNRNSFMVVSHTLPVATGNINNIVNGQYADQNFYLGRSPDVQTQDVTGKTIKFNFGANMKKVITEATFYQSGGQTHGSWQWQGSNDDSTWTNIGSPFTLGGQTTQVINSPLQGNRNGYRYYRILGISGLARYDPWIHEMTFKIAQLP